MYMFEETIFERLLDALRIGDRVLVTSHLFFEFKTNSEKVALAYQLLEEENLLPNLEEVTPKSSKIASELRHEGNKLFKKGDDIAALQFYNRSLAASPPESKEFSLAIGNRSAVNWSLGFYHACLKDIDLALESRYPEELKFKLFERQTKCFVQLGISRKSEDSVKDLIAKSAKESEEKKLPQKEKVQSMNVQPEFALNHLVQTTRPFGCSKTPVISYGINSEIGCASSALELKYSEEKGRHLIATKNIKPGDVLIVEQPYASILLPDVSVTHCYYCFSRCVSPVPCFNCAEVMFCDSNCRTDGWEQSHSVDCSLLPFLFKKVSKMGLLALRVLIIASKKGKDLEKLFKRIENLQVFSDARTLGFTKGGQYVSTEYLPIHFLVGHAIHRANADLFRRSVTAACLLHCLEKFTDFFGGSSDDDKYYFCGGLLLQYLQSLPCNAHEVSEMIVNDGSFESKEIGAAAYATLSLLNHSCDPNVVRHSYRDWAVLRAIRSIEKGEEILDNYGYHHAIHSVDERRFQLSKQYFFHCTCEACQSSWPPYKDQPIANPVYLCTKCRLPLGWEAPCPCGTVMDLQKLELQLKESSKLFRKTLIDVLAGHHKEQLVERLIQHLILLEKCVQRPWREFSECQETIKQCVSLQANHFIISL